MPFLLDTNVVSVLRRPERVDPLVLQQIHDLDRSSCFISVILLMELKMGVLAKARHDTRQALVLDQWVDAIQSDFGNGRIIDIDLAISFRCAALHVPDRLPYNDALIAATALVRDLTFVTRNTSDFEGLGLAILNPWDAA